MPQIHVQAALLSESLRIVSPTLLITISLDILSWWQRTRLFILFSPIVPLNIADHLNNQVEEVSQNPDFFCMLLSSINTKSRMVGRACRSDAPTWCFFHQEKIWDALQKGTLFTKKVSMCYEFLERDGTKMHHVPGVTLEYEFAFTPRFLDGAWWENDSWDLWNE